MSHTGDPGICGLAYFEGQGIDMESEYADLDIASEESDLSSDEDADEQTSSDGTTD